MTVVTRRLGAWVACALVATACLCVGSVPARADDTPVRIASATPTAPEPGTLMPGNEIKMNISIRYGLDGTGTDTLHTVDVTIMLFLRGLDNDFQMEECQAIADTFWSGSHPDFKSTASFSPLSCILKATYYREARHAFYSMDESGHFQLRAPMEYLTQVAASFENASIIQLDARASNIRNAQCNASPSRAIIDTPLIADTHTTSCTWWTSDGAAIPTTDEPLIEGDIEDFFYTYDVGTNGPFVDMTLPINPFTPPTPTASEDATPNAASAAASGDRSEPGRSSSTSLLIGIGAAIATLLLVGTAALVVALRRKH